jgi:formamidopyrimidine-DNA glycosylase
LPELPEVETIVQSLQPCLGATVTQIHIARPDIVRLREYEPKDLLGSTIEKIWRRGKYLILVYGPRRNMVLHLGMSGRFFSASYDYIISEPHVHLVITLGNEYKLLYQDARRFGGVWLVQDISRFFAHLGVEPLSRGFNCGYLKKMIQNRKIPIKSLLLNQDQVCGIGNIYADEALFRAQIRPDRISTTLTHDEVKQLCQAIKKVLRQGIKYRGTTFRDYRDGQNRSGEFQKHLQVYGKEGLPCPNCGKMLTRIKIGGRSSHFCGHCQK